MKRNPVTIIVGCALILLFLLILTVFQVRQTEVAVVTRFGKPTRPLTEPGPYLKWPWPIEKVHHFDNRIHNFESSFDQGLTADGYNLLVMVYTGWKISEPAVFFPRFGGSIKAAEESLEGLVRNAFSGVVGKHPFSHFISVNEKELKFTEMEQEILKKIQDDCRASNYGLEVQFLGLKKIGLPESVTEEVFKQMRSERQLLEARIRNQAEQEASMIKSTAESESAKLISEAEAQAKKIIGEGEAEAAKSFDVFKQEPALASFLLKLSGLEAFLKDRTTLVLDLDAAPLDLLKSPPVPATKGTTSAPSNTEPASKPVTSASSQRP